MTSFDVLLVKSMQGASREEEERPTPQKWPAESLSTRCGGAGSENPLSDRDKILQRCRRRHAKFGDHRFGGLG